MRIVAALSLAMVLAALSPVAQNPPQDPIADAQNHPASKKPAAVKYLFPEQITVPAGKPTPVDLHFEVAEGLHINSHTPHGEEFIATTLALPEGSGVRLAKATFPPGTDYAFAIDPTQKLSVYTGDFTIHAELVSTRGEHLVEATLHYQACNNNACMPPHSIPVAIDVIAK